MNKITRVLVNAIFVGLTGTLIGCGSSGSGGDPSSGSVEDLEDAIADILGTNTTEDTDGSGGDGGDGENPGEVPTVIAELTTLDVSTVDALRGHKVFAGDEIRGAFPGLEDLVEYTFFNLEFPCSGEGEYEAFPAPQFTDFTVPIFGNFTWGSNAGSGNLAINNQGITVGDVDGDVEFDDELPVSTIVDGSLIVGTAVLEMLVVDRIVQFEICQ